MIVNFQKKQALITLTPHPSRSFSRQLDLVVMTIFNQFRHLALDPRIEVRNCSLHSVVSAYRSAAQHARLDQDIFTKGVGEILIATLSDVSYAYKTLVETSGVVLQQSSDSYTSDAGLQHHSRDTALKLWDESLTILFDGVRLFPVFLMVAQLLSQVPRWICFGFLAAILCLGATSRRHSLGKKVVVALNHVYMASR